MIKKRRFKWLPNTLEALAPWYANFALKFQQFAPELGFVLADVSAVLNDNLVVQWLSIAEPVFEANLDGFRGFRDETLYGEVGDPEPQKPVTILPPMPEVFTMAIIERLINLVERIKLAKGYTEDIGAQLDIIGSKSDSIAPDSWKTTLKPKVKAGGDVVVEFVRGDSEGILLEEQKGNETVWRECGRYFKSPADLHYDEPTPQKVRLRARPLLNNKPTGEYSDIVEVITNP